MLVIVWWLPTALILLTSFSSYSLYCNNGWFQVPPKHCHLLSLIALMLRVNVSPVFFLIWPSFLTTQCAPDKHSPFLSWCLWSCCLPYTPFFTYYPSFKTQLKYHLLHEAFCHVTSWKGSLPSSEPCSTCLNLLLMALLPISHVVYRWMRWIDGQTDRVVSWWVDWCMDECLDGL